MDRLNFGLENDSNPFDFLPIEKGSTEKGMEKKLEAEKGLFVALNFPNHTKKMREFGAILTSLVTGPPRKGLLFLYNIKIQGALFRKSCFWQCLCTMFVVWDDGFLLFWLQWFTQKVGNFYYGSKGNERSFQPFVEMWM
ncbi:hypothetical protein SDJN03_00320, partial [Cucurbita argyrosperma subsp. sororia]